MKKAPHTNDKPEDRKKVFNRLILLSGIAVLIIVFSLTFYGDRTSHKLINTVTKYSEHDQVLLHNIYQLLSSARMRVLILHETVEENDPFLIDEKLISLQRQSETFIKARTNITKLKLSAQEKSILEKQSDASAVALSAQKQVIALINSGKKAEAKDILIHKAIPLQNKVIDILSEFNQLVITKNENNAYQSIISFTKTHKTFHASIIIAAIIIIAITLYVISFSGKLFDKIAKVSFQHRQSLNYLESLKKAMDEHDIVSITDVNGNITYANKKFCEISQYSKEELIGKNHRIIKSGCHPDSLFEDMWLTISSGKVWNGEICNKKKDGSLYWVATTIIPFLDENGIPYQYIAVRTNISNIIDAQNLLVTNQFRLEKLVDERTEELQQANKNLQDEIHARKELEYELKSLAERDELTGAYNRRKLNIMLLHEVQRSQRYHNDLSIIIFDIDHFKKINDTFGHQTGDRILKEVVELTLKNIRYTDIFARWGGEEFIIVCPESDLTNTVQTAEKLRTVFEENTFCDSLSVTCSFGVQTFHHNQSLESLISDADEQLYNSKQNGRNTVSYPET